MWYFPWDCTLINFRHGNRLVLIAVYLDVVYNISTLKDFFPQVFIIIATIITISYIWHEYHDTDRCDGCLQRDIHHQPVSLPAM